MLLIMFYRGNLKDYLPQLLNHILCLIIVKFTRSCLKQPKFTYTHKTIVYIYIVYELDATTSNDNDPILKNCLFSAVTLTKNVDMETYGYTGYGLDLIDDQVFHFQVVDLIKMY